MMNVQNLIEEGTAAKAILAPLVQDGLDSAGTFLTITIRINEAKLNEYRQMKSQ